MLGAARTVAALQSSSTSLRPPPAGSAAIRASTTAEAVPAIANRLVRI